MTVLDVDTPHGPANAHLHPATRRAALVLGHGAGGGVGAPDLVAVTARRARAGGQRRARRAALPRRRPPLPAAGAPARRGLDRGGRAPARGRAARPPAVVGGRSSGARVACRTAEATGAVGVLCLAFPLQPPARRGAPRAEPALRARRRRGCRRSSCRAPATRSASRRAEASHGGAGAGDHSLKSDLSGGRRGGVVAGARAREGAGRIA